MTVSRRRPSWSPAWARWTSPWVSTPTVTRVTAGCAIVVAAISCGVGAQADGTRRPSGRTVLRWVWVHRLLSGHGCSAGAWPVVAAAPADRSNMRFPRFPGGPEAWLNGAGRREQHHACTTPVPSGAAGPGGGAGLVERSADRPHR